MVLRSKQAFWRDLPGLLKNRRNRGKWAAYHGEERVAITRSDVDAYQECFRRGLKHEEFYVGKAEGRSGRDSSVGNVRGRPVLFEATDESSPRRRMKILDRLPIAEDRTSLRFGDRYVTVHRNQFLVWVSVHLSGVLEPEANIPRFPALLDTGNNVDFSVQDRHLREWAGIDPGLLVLLGEIEIDGKVVTRRRATVWLYPNVPGRQDVASGRPPFRLKMSKGIAVYAPDAFSRPAIAAAGASRFSRNDLDLWLDPERRHVTVQTRTWRRPLIRLLCRL